MNIDSITKGNSYKKFYNGEEKRNQYIALDIDNFKVVNIVLGKDIGDNVLKKIYEILKFYLGDKGYYFRKNADKYLKA